jgi:hypothetical protein
MNGAKKIFIFSLVFSIFGMIFFSQLKAQSAPPEASSEQFNRKRWQTMIEKTDYFKPEKENKDIVNTKQINEINLGSLKYVMIGLAIALIVLVLLRIFAADLFRKKVITKNKPDFNFNDIEEDLNDAPLYNLLKEAIENKQYKLAIRIYYLIVLQELNQRNIIQWHKDKTNYQYIRELANHPLSGHFRHLTTVFERIWFGEVEEISDKDFHQLQSGFKNYIQTIQQPK